MNKFNKLTSLVLIMLLVNACKDEPPYNPVQRFFVGGYTLEEFNANGKGIYTCSLNTETGEMQMLHVFENSINPSYLAIHPNKKYLYTV